MAGNRPRLEDGTPIDDIDIALYDVTSGSSPMGFSFDPYDNKERVYADDIGGKKLQLRLYGTDVTYDAAGCGANSMRVFVTYIGEDDARNDGNGPSYNAVTCEGVEPL